MNTQQQWVFRGAVISFLCVALGAFAAHALKTRLDEAALHQFELGIRYAFMHSLAIMLSALLREQAAKPLYVDRAMIYFLAGVSLFSGSLLLLALTGIKGFAMLTPLGGLAFLVGWVYLALSMRSSS